MNTSQRIRRIARRLGVCLRTPSSESQKLEAIDDALAPFITAPPYVSEFALVGNTVVLTYSTTVELTSAPNLAQWTLTAVAEGGNAASQSPTAVVQTGPSGITLSFLSVVTPSATYVLAVDPTSAAVVSAETGAREARAGNNAVIWAGYIP